MNKERIKLIQWHFENRNTFIEITMTAILIAIGVHIFAGSLLEYHVFENLYSLLIGFVIILASLFYFASKHMGNRFHDRNIEAFIIYDKFNNKLIDISRYEYSEGLNRFVSAAFSENTALKTLWDREPINKILYPNEKKPLEILFNNKNESKLLLTEASEYLLLEKLSTHLVDYFNNDDYKKDELREFKREDINDILRTNRFVELFSRSMKDRSAFVDETNNNEMGRHGETVYSIKYSGNGNVYIYDKFNLILPKESKIRRTNNNTIVIDTKMFLMEIKVDFRGFRTNIPNKFYENYLGIEYNDKYCAYKIDIFLQQKMKLLPLLFSTKSLQYHRWIDDFLNKIETFLSKDDYFTKINWETVLTMLHCSKIIQEMENKNKPTEDK